MAPAAPAAGLGPENDEEDAHSGQRGGGPGGARARPAQSPVRQGKLVKVDCTQAPAAILTVRTGARTMRLRTDNYKSLLLVGADEFSCEWAERAVIANYKAGGKRTVIWSRSKCNRL